MCILSVYTLLKVVGYYDECSVQVSDGSALSNLFWIFGIFLTLQSP